MVARAASNGWNAATSTPVNFTFGPIEQIPLVLTGRDPSPTGTRLFLGTEGGSGTGDVTFAVSGENCSVLQTIGLGGVLGQWRVLTSSSPTTCVVIATKAGSAGYKPASSLPVSFVFN